MRLEPVSVFRWSYEEGGRVAAPGYAMVDAYGGDEGIGYGEGRGTATGRVEGDVVWSNYPRRRSDGQMLPNARGLIATSDGAAILFELRGRTIFGDDGVGRQNLVGWFESDDERYRWLNDVVCIAEGTIGAEGMEIHVYAGVHDCRPDEASLALVPLAGGDSASRHSHVFRRGPSTPRSR